MIERATDDVDVRRQALDPLGSFIVQAPAGSGKTELLMRRFLTLLTTVNEPEEIIAITFTRKAAGEMRARIVEALERALEEQAPGEAHARISWDLARRARARDAERGWNLARHPARLRIQTIDSLNAELTRRMPLLSQFGTQPDIAERPEPLYIEAAQRTLELLEETDARAADAVATLLRYLDNHVPRVIGLIGDMLPRRDQWLRHTGTGASAAALRKPLEAAIAAEICAVLQQTRDAIPAASRQELTELAAQAGRTLRAQGGDSAIIHCADLVDMPGTGLDDVHTWQGVAELLLTKEGDWRARVDKRQGVAPASPEKTRMQELLRQLASDENLRRQLVRVRALPAAKYPENQWQVLEALLLVLPLAVAQLQLVFAEHGEVDYAEVALRALAALGTATQPTDLSLVLDYRIRHLLVDEFQDTSINQFTLFERLTAGWENGDGRSLFLVGDPMQSIYRFREAQVGLFLRAREFGIGQVKLAALTLTANFRSQASLVEWFNGTFNTVLPAVADIASGAVPYAGAEARHAALPGKAVEIHPLLEADRNREAELVCRLIETARRENPGGSIAVLARSRAQLAANLRRLRHAGVHFRAVELESLEERPVVQDLLALTRALLHAADRTAWLAVLRAPWCGLTLKALHALVSGNPDITVPELLRNEARIAAIQSQVAGTRFMRVRELLLTALAERRRGSLRAQVESLWLRLGAPAVLDSIEDLADAQAYFELLETLEEGAELEDPVQLQSALQALFARPDPEANESLQLMTIHKAKGLEFDTVIVPGLGYGTRRDEKPLLAWLERPRAGERDDLLLAPLNASGDDKDPLFEFVSRLTREQEQLEMGRLLYVAGTRARARLHLIGHVAVHEQDGKPVLSAPRTGSLLKLLWPSVQDDFEKALSGYDQFAEPSDSLDENQPRLRRLRADWSLPLPAPAVSWEGAAETLAADVQREPEFEWVGDTLRHIGTVVHRVLQRIAAEGVSAWTAERLAALEPVVIHWLRELGVPEKELTSAIADVRRALDNTLADPQGRWILDSSHQDARCEYALSAFEGTRLVTGVMDRSFVDNDGVQWIIDYKTSRHEGTDRAGFLRREAERYRPQLQRYAALMRAHEPRPVRAGLYFPLLGAFHEVELN